MMRTDRITTFWMRMQTVTDLMMVKKKQQHQTHQTPVPFLWVFRPVLSFISNPPPLTEVRYSQINHWLLIR